MRLSLFWRRRKPTKFLFKANDDVLSFCQCENQPALSEGQLDCPWCGCGWLMSCSKCTKSFVYAEVRETDIPLIELGRREVAARGLKSMTEDSIRRWAQCMIEDLAPFEVGDIVVYLDGAYWKVDATDVEFEGYYASHSFDRLPHADALTDPAALRAVLGDRQYWLDRERPDRE